MNKSVAVVGDKDTVLAFLALGIDVFPVIEADEARHTIDSLAHQGVGVIFVTEPTAQKIPETIARFDKEILPAIILIPSVQGSLNIGKERINANVEKAVGQNILK
ncbi:MAG: V-type ATP synthase subunit F [Streptococcaceae bacterium]|jgi:V/A-type H+-transporting ATPase subunit F|nr:V-type ATP synthase subunit F [Streptococcaceae bacterium]